MKKKIIGEIWERKKKSKYTSRYINSLELFHEI